ncbi:MAG: hypothetical protein K0Q93_2206 [Nocardioidaceae bacterium]|jgi:hypothetical protein|nr:hypothetical protein [Nocardioidaceae bacterium]
MPRADDIDFDPTDVGVEPADLDPVDLDPADLGAAALGGDALDPADLDPELVHDSGPSDGSDVLEADPVDVAEQRLEVPVDDPEDLG